MEGENATNIREVSQVLGIKENGVTMPVKCKLDTGDVVLVKYWRNPCGTRVLLNEIVGAQIAEKINVTIPEYGLCRLTEEVIEKTNENEEIDFQNAGIGFFSKLIDNTTPIIPGLLSIITNCQTERLLLYDYILNNNDRHKGNMLIDISGNPRLVCIDNSHILLGTHKMYAFRLEDRVAEAKILTGDIYSSNTELYGEIITLAD